MAETGWALLAAPAASAAPIRAAALAGDHELTWTWAEGPARIREEWHG
ncbi:hypothetical protein [Frankia canadensis]|nr:hypothetical protein [Frankia canadensis]